MTLFLLRSVLTLLSHLHMSWSTEFFRAIIMKRRILLGLLQIFRKRKHPCLCFHVCMSPSLPDQLTLQ